MFRKSRKASAVAAPSEPQSPRFLQHKSQADVSDTNAAFSVGVEGSKQKSPGLFSRLFKRSKDEIVSVPLVTESNTTAHQNKRKSLWQRSKSVLRPRAQLDRSESTVLDLPRTHLNICGSGSAAQLLLNEMPIEEFYATSSAVDTDGLLQMIFESNQVMYEQLKNNERERNNALKTESSNAAVYAEGFISPVLSAAVIEPVCHTVHDELKDIQQEQYHDVQHQEEQQQKASLQEEFHKSLQSLKQLENLVLSQSNCNIVYEPPSSHHGKMHFEDNPQLDSPLEDDSVNDSEATLSKSSVSLRSSLQSFNYGEYDLEGVEDLSLDEMASLFDCLQVSEREVLEDGTVRCLVEKDDDADGEVLEGNGSKESIRFHNWKCQLEANDEPKVKKCQSEELLKMNEISVSEPTAAKNNLKARSMSMAAITTTKKKENDEIPFERRRSLGARVSQIVALFEGASPFK